MDGIGLKQSHSAPTGLKDAFYGLTTGAMLGGTITGGIFLGAIIPWFLVLALAGGPLVDQVAQLALIPGALMVGVGIIILATSGWALGLAVLGLPAWWVLNRLGFRSRRAAGLLGAVLTPSAPALMFHSLLASVLFTLAGAIVGVIIWRTRRRADL